MKQFIKVETNLKAGITEERENCLYYCNDKLNEARYACFNLPNSQKTNCFIAAHDMRDACEKSCPPA